MKNLTSMATCKDKEALPFLMPFYYQSDGWKTIGGHIRSRKRVQYITRQMNDTVAKFREYWRKQSTARPLNRRQGKRCASSKITTSFT